MRLAGQCNVAISTIRTLPLFQLPVHECGVDLSTGMRHQAGQGGPNGCFVVPHGGLFAWKDLGSTPFGGIPVPRDILPRMDNDDETLHVGVKADTTFHPHTGREAFQGR